MTTNVKPTVGEAYQEQGSLAGFLNRLSLRNKIIGVAVLVFLLLLVISIPGDRSELLARQVKVDAAQIAYDLALPAVAPIMGNVIALIDDVDVDLSANRSYTGLSSTLTAFNRDNATVVSRFQAILTFSENVHRLLDGTNAVPELDTNEFRTLVAELDTTLSVAWSAMMDLNIAIDEYNGYHAWLSARAAAALSGLPEGYTDPLPANSRLNRESLIQ
jgi:hypothetical protein